VKLLGIDPGTTQSGFVVMNVKTLKLTTFGKIENEKLIKLIPMLGCEHMAIEQIKSYGQAMGDTTIETCVWIGRFIERWGMGFTLIPRKTIVSELCGTSRAKDSNIRRMLLDFYAEKFPAELGEGNEPSVGTKEKPGPLYGVKADAFSALALSIVWVRKFYVESQEFLR
jgi:hypothetical protein